jgi:hypothetical protein
VLRVPTEKARKLLTAERAEIARRTLRKSSMFFAFLILSQLSAIFAVSRRKSKSDGHECPSHLAVSA